MRAKEPQKGARLVWFLFSNALNNIWEEILYGKFPINEKLKGYFSLRFNFKKSPL